MSEKWGPKPAVFSGRNAVLRKLLIKRCSHSYISGEPVKSLPKPPMDSIWEWSKGTEIGKGKAGGEIVDG